MNHTGAMKTYRTASHAAQQTFLWLVIKFIIAASLVVAFYQYVPLSPLITSGILAAYLAIAYVCRPKLDPEESWLGGLLYNPFNLYDEDNLLMVVLSFFFLPGILIADTLVGFCVKMTSMIKEH